LFNTLRLQWMGKKIGFEKISYKKDTLKGFFVNNPKSSYYDSVQFGKVLQFVQAHPTVSNLKEVKGQLRLAVSNVNSITYALQLLREILQYRVLAYYKYLKGPVSSETGSFGY